MPGASDDVRHLSGLIDVEVLRTAQAYGGERSGVTAERSGSGRPPAGGRSAGGRSEESLENTGKTSATSESSRADSKNHVVVRASLRPVSRNAERVVEDLLLDLRRDSVRMRIARAAFFFDQRGDATDLEGTAHLVERIAVIAHQLAGLGDVAELLGQLQLGQFSLGTLGKRSRLGSSFRL